MNCYRYFACLCNRNERAEVPDEWIQKALYLDLPFDNVKRLHYQYEGYDQCKVLLYYSLYCLNNTTLFLLLYTIKQYLFMTYSFINFSHKQNSKTGRYHPPDLPSSLEHVS